MASASFWALPRTPITAQDPGPEQQAPAPTDLGGPKVKLAQAAGPWRTPSRAHRPFLCSLRPPGKNDLPSFTSRTGVAGPGTSTQGCPGSAKPTGHSRAQGRPSTQGLEHRQCTRLKETRILGTRCRVLTLGPGFVVRSFRNLSETPPFPPHSLGFVQKMLICILKALRRPAEKEPNFV